MNLLITGGCGYVGSVLVPRLLEQGHDVRVIDTKWFGNHLQAHSALTVIEGDIRSIQPTMFTDIDAVIHLANIANDPGVESNPSLLGGERAPLPSRLRPWPLKPGSSN